MDILGLFDGFFSLLSATRSSQNNKELLKESGSKEEIEESRKQEIRDERMEELRKSREQGNQSDKSNDRDRNY